MEVKAITPVNTVSKIALNERAVTGKGSVEIKNQQAQVNKQFEGNVTREDAKSIADIMNKVSELYNRQLRFDVYEDTNRLYVQIIDENTQEVIKQIPPEEMLELSAKIQEMVGIMLDKYV